MYSIRLLLCSCRVMSICWSRWVSLVYVWHWSYVAMHDEDATLLFLLIVLIPRSDSDDSEGMVSRTTLTSEFLAAVINWVRSFYISHQFVAKGDSFGRVDSAFVNLKVVERRAFKVMSHLCKVDHLGFEISLGQLTVHCQLHIQQTKFQTVHQS
jgi:hypothetical protein